MPLLEILVLLVIMFGVAIAAVGRGGELAPVPRATSGPAVLPHPLTADDLDRLRFSVVPRGYRMQEVDAALERVAAALRERDARISELEAALAGRGDPADAG